MWNCCGIDLAWRSIGPIFDNNTVAYELHLCSSIGGLGVVYYWQGTNWFLGPWSLQKEEECARDRMKHD